MIVFISFIFFLAIGISILLLFNKSNEAEEIKSVLKEALANLKSLFINLKDLTVLLIRLIKNNLQEESMEIDAIEGNEKPTKEESITPEQSSNKPESFQSQPEKLETQIIESEKSVEKPYDQDTQLNQDIEKENTADLASNEIDQKLTDDSGSNEIITEISNKSEDIAS